MHRACLTLHGLVDSDKQTDHKIIFEIHAHHVVFFFLFALSLHIFSYPPSLFFSVVKRHETNYTKKNSSTPSTHTQVTSVFLYLATHLMAVPASGSWPGRSTRITWTKQKISHLPVRNLRWPRPPFNAIELALQHQSEEITIVFLLRRGRLPFPSMLLCYWLCPTVVVAVYRDIQLQHLRQQSCTAAPKESRQMM